MYIIRNNMDNMFFKVLFMGMDSELFSDTFKMRVHNAFQHDKNKVYTAVYDFVYDVFKYFVVAMIDLYETREQVYDYKVDFYSRVGDVQDVFILQIEKFFSFFDMGFDMNIYSDMNHKFFIIQEEGFGENENKAIDDIIHDYVNQTMELLSEELKECSVGNIEGDKMRRVMLSECRGELNESNK